MELNLSMVSEGAFEESEAEENGQSKDLNASNAQANMVWHIFI